MNMKKSLIAMAVAGVVAVPMSAQAAEVYGRVNLAVASTNDDANATGEGGLAMANVSSRFGAKGSEDLGNGMTAHYQYEFAVNATNATFQPGNRLSWVGLSGDFGRVEVGRIWSLWWDYLGAKVDWSWSQGGVGYYNMTFGNTGAGLHRISDSIQYTNDLGAVEFGVEARMTPAEPAAGEESFDHLIIGAQGDVGPVNVAVTNVSENNASGNPAPSITGFGASWSSGALTLGGVYQMLDRDAGGNADPTSLDLLAAMSFGNGLNGYVGYGMFDADDGNAGVQDTSGFWATLDKSLSSRTGTYVEFSSVSNDSGAAADADPRTILFGLRHDF